jgi:hypothetical protein
MQPKLGRRRHRRSDITISLVSRGYAVGCYVQSHRSGGSALQASFARHPCHEGTFPLLSVYRRWSTGLVPLGQIFPKFGL